MRISASTLKAWMSCPLQAKFAKIDNLPQRQNAKASFGSIIHHCLEHYNTHHDLDTAIAIFRDLWENPEKFGVAPDYWPKMTSYMSLRDRGLEILRNYDAGLKWDERTVLFTEHPFCVPFGRHELKGIVDLGEVRKSGKGKNLLRIVDFKTNSSMPNMGQLALDIQFTIYVYASMQPEFWTGNGEIEYPGMPNGAFLYELYKDMPRRAIWWHLWNPREIDAGSRDDEDFMRLYRLIDEVERAVTHEVFVPRIGEACSLCSYTEQCGLTIPTKEQLMEDQDAWL